MKIYIVAEHHNQKNMDDCEIFIDEEKAIERVKELNDMLDDTNHWSDEVYCSEYKTRD